MKDEVQERHAKALEAQRKRLAAAAAERERRHAKDIKRFNADADNFKRNRLHTRARQGARVLLPALDGCIFVVSDQHYYPGLPPTTAHRASVKLAKKMKPYAIISNGDAIDGASISRWPAGSFEELDNRPTVFAEMEEAAARLKEYEDLNFVRWLVWNLGNHDARFETRLARAAPEYAGVDGFHLKDHYPGWLPAWSTWIGEDGPGGVIVKHRYKGGMYAAKNNAFAAGRTMVTGHDHTMWAKPITDYNGMRWGITAGTISDIWNPLFINYTEDNPNDWQSGFVILHFRSGRFTGPEFVYALQDGSVLFRGNELKV